jgi:hypothetical protein
MSLGNVSSARVNRQHFHEALEYLRKASEIPEYELPLHLQQYVFPGSSESSTYMRRYLDEYGPLDLMD